MKITGQVVQQVCDALVDAYPNRDLLGMMVRFELNEKLDEIAGGENQRVIIFNLVSWSERQGRLDELVARAHKYNPGNEALKQLAAEWRVHASSAVASPITSPLAGMAEGTGPTSIDLFLSYSRKDSVAMHQVQETLRAAGLSVWTDEGLDPGTPSWKDAISEAVEQAYAMVVLLSPNSKHSKWVQNEIGFAQILDKRIFPILIAGEVANAVPIDLINTQWVDVRQHLDFAMTQKLLPALLYYLQHPDSNAQASQIPVAEQVTEDSYGHRFRNIVSWIAAAAVIGALALFLWQLFSAQPPAPTTTAMNSTPVQTEMAHTPAQNGTPASPGVPSTATITARATEAALVLSPVLSSTEGSTPTPTATQTATPTPTPTPTPAPKRAALGPLLPFVNINQREYEVPLSGPIKVQAEAGSNLIIEIVLQDAFAQETEPGVATYEWRFNPPDPENARRVGNLNSVLYYTVPSGRSGGQLITVDVAAAGFRRVIVIQIITQDASSIGPAWRQSTLFHESPRGGNNGFSY